MRLKGASETLLGLSTMLSIGLPVRAQAPDPPRPPATAAPKPRGGEESPEKAVTLLVEQLREHPARPSKSSDRLGLHLIDVDKGEVTLIADEPDPGLVRCGSPTWSHDGKRIVFDAMPMNQVPSTHLKSIELVGGQLAMTDLGLGNCPTFSPSDDRIAFLNNSAADGADLGVWLMHADGSGRRLLGHYGRPLWAPDSRQLMIVSFTRPRQVTLMDVRPEMSGPLQITGKRLFWEPSWAGDGMIVAAIGSETADSIALIDVREPALAKVKEVLWEKGQGLDVVPYYPVYSARTRRVIFVGSGPKGLALYGFEPGKVDPPRRLESEGSDKLLQDLAYSPDGRYLLFSSDRAGRGQPKAVPGDGGAPGPKDRTRVGTRKMP